jgi:hypothetical protein
MWGSEGNDVGTKVWTHLSCEYSRDYEIVTWNSLKFLECMVLRQSGLTSQESSLSLLS